MQEEYLAHRETIETEAQEAEDARIRQEKEWDYDFARRCQAKTDKVNDDLSAKMKEHNTLIEAEYKTLKERKEAIAKQEAEIEALRNRVESIPAEIDLAVADAKKRLDTSHAIEISALKRNHEADQKILAHEVKALSETNKRLSEMVENLETKLEHAYDKIQGVATQALDAQGHARTTAEVQKAVQSAAPSGKR